MVVANIDGGGRYETIFEMEGRYKGVGVDLE